MKNVTIINETVPDVVNVVEGQIYKKGEKIPKGFRLTHNTKKGLVYTKIGKAKVK